MTSKTDLKFFVFGLIFILVIAAFSIFKNAENKGFSFGTGTSGSMEEIQEKVLTHINNEILVPQGLEPAISTGIEEDKGLYKISIEIQGQEDVLYATKDGQYIFPAPIFDLTPAQKVDKADVKLFVMSQCPFGLQAEKMYIPVYELLKDKVDMGIYYVNYAMHGKEEMDHNVAQYCIQKEQEDKFTKYLQCYVSEEGKHEACLAEADIDMNLLNTCIAATDQEFGITESFNSTSTWLSGRFPQFGIHDDLNIEYGVQGSPTIILNGKEAELRDRSPEAFKDLICDSMDNPPSECETELSTTAAQAGYGWDDAIGSTTGSCQ